MPAPDASVQAKLRVERLSHEFAGPSPDHRLRVLENVDFSARPGEFIALVGPSGCGKSTLLSLLDGLLRPASGRVLMDGREVTGPGADRALVFQAASLFPWRTILRNIAYGLEIQGVGRRRAHERAIEMIELVGLKGFEQFYPYSISGGMAQRVNLARALAVDPDILLMDEPFAALDAQTREVMQEELLQIWLRAKKTVLFITHQINEAIYLSDRVIVFSARPGRVKQTLPVAIERPRKLVVKRDPRFHQLEDDVWNLIEDEVKKTMLSDRSSREAVPGGRRDVVDS